MSWFRELVGFDESADAIRAHLVLDGAVLESQVNGRRMRAGELTMPSLGELRVGAEPRPASPDRRRLQVSEVVADVAALHRDPENADALFQVASQFNLLEMVSPTVTPEAGVTGYENDRTQGPACAVACGAGTIYRNWFVPIDGRPGQTASRQLDMLAGVGTSLGNGAGRLWTMQNGYALATGDGLAGLPERHDALRVGVQSDTEVTMGTSGMSTAATPSDPPTVTQVYCSALPVAYTSGAAADRLEPLARMILNSSYAATMHLARLRFLDGGSPRVYLTLLGGGVFGNRIEWILDAMEAALDEHRDVPLDVRIVSYSRPRPELTALLTD